jgi:hypothetical protein
MYSAMHFATGRIRFLFVVLIGLLAGCANIDAKSTVYAGAPHFGPTDAASVEILRDPPTKPHDRIGEIRLDASTNPAPPVIDIENKLREEGARIGADAVVIVYDRLQPVGANVTGGWWNRSVDVITDQRMVAVAIHYRQ